MSSETDYYLIEGGTALKIFKEWNKLRLAQSKKRSAFLKRFKTKNYYSYGDNGVAGLVFKEEPDQAVWRRDPKGNAWVPRKTTPEGKALNKEMHSLRDPSIEALTKDIVGVGNIFWGMRVYHGGLDYLDHKPVILMPNPFGEKGPPKTISTKKQWKLGFEPKLVDGVRLLKRSEYWELKEAEYIGRGGRDSRRQTTARQLTERKDQKKKIARAG